MMQDSVPFWKAVPKFSSFRVLLFDNDVERAFANAVPSPFAPILSDFKVPFVPRAFAIATPPLSVIVF